MEALLSTEIIASFVTLSVLEIILGIDNLIFIALVADGLPEQYRQKARVLGLSLALLIRVVMLLGISWVMSLTQPLVTIMDQAFSFKDLLLLGGGVFLIGKATFEMHTDVLGLQKKHTGIAGAATLVAGVTQIVLIDFVFSFDSIITAVGLTENIPVIVAAIVVAMAIMLFASGGVSDFLRKYPTFKMLALSFILMIGVLLVAEGMHAHVPRGYLYFAFGFSLFVEFLNTIASKKRRERK